MRNNASRVQVCSIVSYTSIQGALEWSGVEWSRAEQSGAGERRGEIPTYCSYRAGIGM